MKLGEIKAAVEILPFGRIIVFLQLFPFSETSSRVATERAFRMAIMQKQMAAIWVTMGAFEIIAIFGGNDFFQNIKAYSSASSVDIYRDINQTLGCT